MKSKICVIIAAGGSGLRMGADMPKQYIEINSKPIIAHTLQTFEDCNLIDDIIISCHKDYVVYTKDISQNFGFKKIKYIVSGGKTRMHSVYNALKLVDNSCDYVAVHDAARPFVTKSDIENCIKNARIYGCCTLGEKVSDTLKKSDEENFILNTVNRENLWRIQTPQIFKRDVLLKAYEYAFDNNISATDDCMLIESMGYKIKILESEGNNFKITCKKDLILAEALL